MRIRNRLWLVVGSYIRKKRYEPVRPWLKGNVLDIGCGPAYLARFVEENRTYVGIDGKEELIETLQKNHRDLSNRKFHCINIENENELSMLISYTSFNTIILLAVIEHLRNPKIILSFCKKMLADDGTLVLTTPTRGGDKIGSLLYKHLSSKKEFTFPHVKIYDKRSLNELLESYNFRVDIYSKFEYGMNQLFVCSKKGYEL